MPSRHAARLFLAGAACWIVGGLVLLIWILYLIGPDPAGLSGDGGLVLLITSPIYLVALAGVGILVAGRGSERVARVAVVWSAIALCVGLVASLQGFKLVWLALSGNLHFTLGADWIATYQEGEGGAVTNFVYAYDFLPLWLVIWGFLAVGAAVWDRRVARTPRLARERELE
jgi:hypothetical protein